MSIAEGTGDTMVLLSYIHTRQLFLFIIPLIFFIMCNFIIDIDRVILLRLINNYIFKFYIILSLSVSLPQSISISISSFSFSFFIQHNNYFFLLLYFYYFILSYFTILLLLLLFYILLCADEV